MRKLASIQRIKKVMPIEGADRIELVSVLGWQCVAVKDEFKKGDLCVYFEIDSFLPIRPEFEFLRSSSFKNNEILGEGFWLKTKVFKGKISQGLVLPLSTVGIVRKDNGDSSDNAKDYVFVSQDGSEIEMIDLIKPTSYNNLTLEGLDVTDLIGVKKWVIPEAATTGGTIMGNLPYGIHKTDEMRIQSTPELLEEFRGKPYYITTKYDGSSHSISLDRNGDFHVTGHNYEYKDDGKSSFYEYVKKHGFEQKLRDYVALHGLLSITVQGEWCGPGLQKNRLKLAQPEWFVFTVDVDEKRVGWDEIRKVASECGMNIVECQEISETDDLPTVYPTVDELIKRSEHSIEKSTAYKGGQPEGIVIRPLTPVWSDTLGDYLSMKVINNKYLIKNEK